MSKIVISDYLSSSVQVLLTHGVLEIVDWLKTISCVMASLIYTCNSKLIEIIICIYVMTRFNSIKCYLGCLHEKLMSQSCLSVP